MSLPRLVVAFAANALFLCTYAICQDATLSPILWSDPARAPDEPPVLKRTPPLTFPEALRNTTDLGYVVFDAVIDSHGKHLLLTPHTTVPSYFRSGDSAVDQFRFSPGRREGEAVTTAVTFAFIFNPESAALNGPEATPRLLQVTAVRLKSRKGAGQAFPAEETVVYADVHVDESGNVTEIENAPDGLHASLTIAARNWHFAPARHLGQPVSAVVHAPFVLVPPRSPTDPRKSTQPVVISRTPPVYPWAMRASGMRGEVLVDFVVDIEGRTRNAFVTRTLNPSFDDAALESVRTWRFRPGMVDGVPVNTHMMVPIVFQLQGLENGGADGVDIANRADLSKLPPEFQYDTPPRIRASARPVFPYSALAARQSGSATVIMFIDRTGRVARADVRQATSPEFGAALLAAIDRFAYQPATKDGVPCLAMLAFRQEFSFASEYGMVSSDDSAMLRREQKKPLSILGAREVDGPLKPRSRQPPLFPLALQKTDTTEGDATIEFIVDEEGRARLPRIVSATNIAFGYSAAQSVATWRFEPPTRGGRAVAVRVQVPFHFRGGVTTPQDIPPPPEP